MGKRVHAEAANEVVLQLHFLILHKRFICQVIAKDAGYD
jgi:hypothetical protein